VECNVCKPSQTLAHKNIEEKNNGEKQKFQSTNKPWDIIS